MNREIIAKELVRIAKDLMAMDFSSEEAMHNYLKEHPNANRENHKVVSLHKNGQKNFEGSYNDKGQKHGEHISYHPLKPGENNQRTKDVMNYHNGILHGPQHGLHPNGKRAFSMNYHHGRMQGEQKSWDHTGKLTGHKKTGFWGA